MKVLVTGGAGFLGVALCKALAARGDIAIAMDIAATPALIRAAANDDRILIRPGDITDMSNIARVFKVDKPEAVIHAAAMVGVIASLGSASNVFRVNMEGTINLWETMALFDVRRCIHISSEETYGNFQADRVTEDHPLNPLYAYGVTKVAIEHLGRTYGITHGIENINLRTSWVYGPEFPRMRIPRDVLEAACHGKSLHLPSGSESKIDHTYLDDFVRGVMLALDHVDHPFDVYHVASDSCPTVGEMFTMVRELVPNADVSVGPGVYKHAGKVDIPRKGALDCSRAREVFGYRPKFDLRAGLAANLDYLNEALKESAVPEKH
jgi:UDP-glucose 4-epimerase